MWPSPNSAIVLIFLTRPVFWQLWILSSSISPMANQVNLARADFESFKTRLENLFERFTVRLAVIVAEIRLLGDVAYDYGWHDLTLTPKNGIQSIRRRDRYVDIWRRNKEGEWKLWMYMDNLDIADPFEPESVQPVQQATTVGRSSYTTAC